MEIDLKVFGKKQIESTTGTNSMKISKDASQMIFRMFTETIYSNPIGTVVREIASNCFDSHVEAGVDRPVLIKKSYDETTETYYISFIDYGVGMSPDRVKNVYGVYFESNKRDGNEQIGGFGIGGKTPLAYKRVTGEGEGEYDNSFFVITNHEGTKYYYTVFEGQASPEFSLFHKEATDEGNGTEVRIPVLQKDISTFEKEIVRQLFYFEGLVFEGFSETVTNDYQIIRGKNFLFRGGDLDSKVHVCLGRVYYPLDYNVLNLNSYDYQIPVAINVPIGAIGVTPSRENILYSNDTIKYIKKRLDDVKDELKALLSKQYSHVTELEDMFKFKQNFGTLYLTDTKSVKLGNIIKQDDVDLTKYKYRGLKLVESSTLFKLFFDVHTYGKKEAKSRRHSDRYDTFRKDYDGLSEATNLFHAPDNDSYTLKRIKQSYLKSVHGRYYLIVPRDLKYDRRGICDAFNISFNSGDDFTQSTTLKRIKAMQEDYYAIVRKFAAIYEDVEIPEDFKLSYNSRKPKLEGELLKQTIPVSFGGGYKYRVKLVDLINFSGKIFFGDTDDSYLSREMEDIFESLFGSEYVADSYNTYSKTIGERFGSKKASIMFVTVAKNNVKYFQYCKKAYPIRQFNSRILRRKIDHVITAYKNVDIKERYERLDSFYKGEWLGKVSKVWSNRVVKVKEFIDQINGDTNKVINMVNRHRSYFSKYFTEKAGQTTEEKKIRDLLNKLEELQEKNKDVLRYIEIPSNGWTTVNKEMDDKMIPMLLKSVMSLT